MTANAVIADPVFQQSPSALMEGEYMAIAYSGFREGQHPDRGEGANNPTPAQILEDLKILVKHNFNLIRMYDSGENTETTLALIKKHNLPIKVLLGMWLKAEISNHEGCPWLHEPIPQAELDLNKLANQAEVQRGIKLANQYKETVVAINVGNEALVEWNDHMVTLDAMIRYVREVKAMTSHPVSTADNYDWWRKHGAPLAKEVDFLGVHSYPVWENKPIESGLSYTVDNLLSVQQALPNKPIVVLEAGWATTATEFPEQANTQNQVRYYQDMMALAKQSNTTIFFFEAFDEPWKGDENNPNGAEKHWGLFYVDRKPKPVME
ncbi:glycosyl hydrolase family 17 protein [Aliikangiella marina]|nr:glycosyl hydrolase family 17 protein [Aliikangiella marina]